MAFTLCIAVPGAAQQGPGGSGGSGGSAGSGGGGGGGSGGSDDGSECMTAPSSECTERCPTFDTCYLDGVGGQAASLYYRVGEQRFDCQGLVCEEAALRKNDYCCQRGEFAPDEGGGDGGCTLRGAPGARSTSTPSGSNTAWLCVALGAGVLGLGRIRRRRQQRG